MSEKQPDASAHKPTAGPMPSLRMRVHRLLWSSIRVPLEAEFRYTADEPLSVSVELHTQEGHAVAWLISRDLLYDGTREPSGMGDVRLWPSVTNACPVVCMRLERRGMSVLLEMDLRQLKQWLLETFGLVHRGTETDQVDWDAVVAGLVEG